MEVATTNNHHHHNHHAHHQQQLTVVGGNGNSNSNSNNNSNNNNSIIKNGGARSPFQREVREWQRIDPDTGALLSGRLEADRWINGPLNSYGKISDSQNISQPNGTQQTQRKQFEVLQARTANGAMQVIRTHTVQTTSSRWSSTTNTSSSSTSSPATILDKNNYNNSFNTYHNNNNYNNKHCHIANTSYSPYRTPPTTTITTTTLPTNSNAIDICEISDDDFMQNTEHRLNGDNIVVTLIDEDDNDNKNDMFNGNSNNNTHTLNHNHRSDSLRKLGHNLLLDTAPSLKLSNLMKSSSSISSQSSNNSYTNTTTSAATMNTHRNAAKISLHAIVGNNNNNTNNTAKSATSSSSTTASSSSSLLTNTATLEDRITAATSSSSSSTATTTPWHKRLSEQPDLYGNSNNKLNQSRVGVNSSIVDGSGVGGVTETAGGGGGGGADDIAAVRQTPTQVNRQTRRDLESFRHYNEHAKSSTYDNDDNDDDDDDDNDEDLRLTARHQRRQQVPQYAPIPLQRSRSISTDDLSNDWDRNDLGQHTDDEPGEWRRVSKLRRSFQSTSTSSSSNTTSTPRRPLDLPSNSVSVSRIRAELENGRRLNTAMRNNHVDLAALDTMLNATAAATAAAAEKQALAKRNTFLTAESLKEIRGKLKKLSDESLYKEDFLAYQAPRETPDFEQEHIEVQLVKPLPFVETRSAFQPVVRTGTDTQRTLYPYASSNSSSQANPGQTTHKTHSLESRQKYRDTNSSEWHLRRKSYGFEKMSPPEDRSIFRVDASTDSGLGRSGDQLGNWSPTETSSNARGTIIHFGEPQQQQQQQQLTTSYRRPSKSPETGELNKRHSIAVAEESQYIRKTSQVHLNGINGEPIADASTTSRHTQQKRVEFCKTEVHFAAESGRVNIVETDGKPPPTNNFRRRRRSSAGPLQSLVKSATTVSTPSTNLPMTHFGDDHRSKSNTASTTVAYKATLMEPPELVTQPTHVTVTTPKPLESSYSLTETTSTSTSRNSYTSTSGIDTTTDNETDEISAIRGILKNKPIKPKPYHLGENIDSADALWGVQLKTAPTDRQQAALDEAPASPKSVAERVRIVEKRQVEPESNGYSTKINLSLGEKDWHETDLPKSNVMSIALHSPKAEPQLEQQKKPVLRVSQLVPVAKPRTTLSSVPTAMQPEVHTALCVKQSNDSTSDSDSLKIVKEARGARKLREHELSYFGVQVSKAESMSSKSSTHQTNRRSLPSRKLSAEERHNQTTTKWQLLNDRPDLLRHSPIEPQASSIKAAERQSLKQKTVASDEDFDEHFYENIAHDLQPSFRVKSPTPNAYDRKTDVQRDVQILSEMTRNADQTLKALSDEAALKDQRRRSSLQRRNSKPLETIDEKSFTSDKTSDSLSIARGTYASEARRNSRQSTPSPTHARSSSQSSLECCPRARSRSLSSEREYENVKTRRSVQHTKPTTTSTRRSSSRDSATQCSSGEEQLKREERLRTRTPKRINSSNSSSTQAREKQRLSSGTHAVEKRRDEGSALKQRSSSMRERTERERKSTHERTHSSSRRHQHKHDDGDRSSRQQHGSGSNDQRVRSHSSDRHERHPGTRLVRAARVHEHESNGQRASAQRLERHDKEKDKHSRSRGHSNRSSHSEREREHKPTTTRTTTTNTAQQAHRKSSSSKSSTTTTTANKHAHKTQSAQQALNEHELTHGKNTQLLNGHHGHQHGQHNQHIQHSLATTTITAKQRERHGKDRK